MLIACRNPSKRFRSSITAFCLITALASTALTQAQAAEFAAAIDLGSLDGSNGFQISGEAEGDFSGRSVKGAGDINGDGFADLVIGAYFADPNDTNSGASYVVFGKAGGLPSRSGAFDT